MFQVGTQLAWAHSTASKASTYVILEFEFHFTGTQKSTACFGHEMSYVYQTAGVGHEHFFPPLIYSANIKSRNSLALLFRHTKLCMTCLRTNGSSLTGKWGSPRVYFYVQVRLADIRQYYSYLPYTYACARTYTYIPCSQRIYIGVASQLCNHLF